MVLDAVGTREGQGKTPCVKDLTLHFWYLGSIEV